MKSIPLLPIPLGEDPHASIQDPDQRTPHPDQERCVEEAVLSHLMLAVLADGPIARVWSEYLANAIKRVNDQNAHKMVLYLAHHEPEERTRTQIRDDLKLEMSDPELDKHLKQLVYADILAQGGSNFHFRGLGDPVFPMVFRRIYGAEIEQVSVEQIDDDFKSSWPASRSSWPAPRGWLPDRLFADSLSQQAGDLPETLKGQTP